MSDRPYEWIEGNHYCEKDAHALHSEQPHLLKQHGPPKMLVQNPVPPTFCSICLGWFDDPKHAEGSDHRPPTEKGSTP